MPFMRMHSKFMVNDATLVNDIKTKTIGVENKDGVCQFCAKPTERSRLLQDCNKWGGHQKVYRKGPSL